MIGWELETAASLPICYCADSGSKPRHQCKMTALLSWKSSFQFCAIGGSGYAFSIFYCIYVNVLLKGDETSWLAAEHYRKEHESTAPAPDHDGPDSVSKCRHQCKTTAEYFNLSGDVTGIFTFWAFSNKCKRVNQYKDSDKPTTALVFSRQRWCWLLALFLVSGCWGKYLQLLNVRGRSSLPVSVCCCTQTQQLVTSWFLKRRTQRGNRDSRDVSASNELSFYEARKLRGAEN